MKKHVARKIKKSTFTSTRAPKPKVALKKAVEKLPSIFIEKVTGAYTGEQNGSHGGGQKSLLFVMFFLVKKKLFFQNHYFYEHESSKIEREL